MFSEPGADGVRHVMANPDFEELADATLWQSDHRATPSPSSPLLAREQLYTAVTRARERVVVIGTEAAVRSAVERPAARLSGRPTAFAERRLTCVLQPVAT